jgi:ParB-like chromosome segregation protein Spo0J
VWHSDGNGGRTDPAVPLVRAQWAQREHLRGSEDGVQSASPLSSWGQARLMFISLDKVLIKDRIREDIRGTKEEWAFFKNSFKIHGQLQPIRVEECADDKFKLLAGHRRLLALTELFEEGAVVPGNEHGLIECTFRDPIPLHKQLLQEFAENNERKDFTYVERAKFIRRFHDTMQLEYGQDAWSQELTARTLNLSPASISHYLRVEEAIKSDPTIAKAGTLDAAVKRMKVQERLDARKDRVEKEDDSVMQRAAEVLALGDAREWIKTLSDESADFVNFDPPWGDEVSFKSAENHEAFDDSTEYAEALMDELFPQIYRILRADRFCAFWFRAWSPEYMAAKAQSFGFNLQFTRTPCIWYKPDKVADQNRMPEKQLIEAYETFYLLRKGDPIFHERYTHNVFSFDRVPLANIIHPTEKPVALCEAIIKLCTIPGETLVDPTAGSSAMLEQALRSNRKALGCELSERNHGRGLIRIAEYLKTFSVK